ncbi:U32 family peptidase [Desulfobaculum bizertense]|uniref:peptidase U32 family protein n=1 Tax=Desulfobaculum bizertense TaxID=376490 RepID=UPI001F188EA7|nr:U32 family peptidase [Desulfobaculum bizertense]UIJ36695.1 U32 family peptidase [Desulfobaculum bizertense]
MNMTQPEILAPAGDRHAFMAALAAGADAIYLGLKNFSARAEAGNFSISELAVLTELARQKNCRVHVAMNTLLKPGEDQAAGRLVERLNRYVRPAALIVQDPGMVKLVRQAGFEGEIHLSTLANAGSPRALSMIHEKLNVQRIVLPRELNIDEIRTCAKACPSGCDLEVFVHGALCYNVSGRCYWSSYLGGKSGLRGRCVQPCRRTYSQKNNTGRFFSCTDLSLDVLTKTLLEVPEVRSWKIEGRRKGPHYVYYTVSAYRLLRDNPNDPQARKTALSLLEQALGRKGSHYAFLPQRPYTPTDPQRHTASGMFVDKLKTVRGRKLNISPRVELKPGDLLRVGFEDEPGHQIVKIRKAVPKGGRLDFMAQGKRLPNAGSPVFLIDRREKELMQALDKLEREAQAIKAPKTAESTFEPKQPKPLKGTIRPLHHHVYRHLGRNRLNEGSGLWLTPKTARETKPGLAMRVWWWLPPVIWPNEEKEWQEVIERLVRGGARRFMLGAPWQIALFPKELPRLPRAVALRRGRGKRHHSQDNPRKSDQLNLWASPFCNVANQHHLLWLKDMGFSGAIASPELNKDDALALGKATPLPVGFVTTGQWPLGFTRIPLEGVKPEKPILSPKKEACWVRRYGQLNWIYPAWGLDLHTKEHELNQAGYSAFIHMHESKPREVPQATRTSTFNWDLRLL